MEPRGCLLYSMIQRRRGYYAEPLQNGQSSGRGFVYHRSDPGVVLYSRLALACSFRFVGRCVGNLFVHVLGGEISCEDLLL